jgi:hypothetical protein
MVTNTTPGIYQSAYRPPPRCLAQRFGQILGTQVLSLPNFGCLGAEFRTTDGKYLVEVAAYYNILP